MAIILKGQFTWYLANNLILLCFVFDWVLSLFPKKGCSLLQSTPVVLQEVSHTMHTSESLRWCLITTETLEIREDLFNCTFLYYDLSHQSLTHLYLFSLLKNGTMGKGCLTETATETGKLALKFRHGVLCLPGSLLMRHSDIPTTNNNEIYYRLARLPVCSAICVFTYSSFFPM